MFIYCNWFEDIKSSTYITIFISFIHVVRTHYTNELFFALIFSEMSLSALFFWQFKKFFKKHQFLLILFLLLALFLFVWTWYQLKEPKNKIGYLIGSSILFYSYIYYLYFYKKNTAIKGVNWIPIWKE
jgi:hypothetical protein